MAFKDLHEGIAELFDHGERLDDAQIARSLTHRSYVNERTKAKRAEQLLDDRLRRKRARTKAERAIPPLTRIVACTTCRLDFVEVEDLDSHCAYRHRTREPAVACWCCREPCASEAALVRHFRTHHPDEHAAARSANHSLAASRRLRRETLQVVAVRTYARVDAPVAYTKTVAASSYSSPVECSALPCFPPARLRALGG